MTQTFRIVYNFAHEYNKPKVAFVEAHTVADAQTLLRDEIERRRHVPAFAVHVRDAKAYVRPEIEGKVTVLA